MFLFWSLKMAISAFCTRCIIKLLYEKQYNLQLDYAASAIDIGISHCSMDNQSEK
jgi:hypothetical protein